MELEYVPSGWKSGSVRYRQESAHATPYSLASSKPCVLGLLVQSVAISENQCFGAAFGCSQGSFGVLGGFSEDPRGSSGRPRGVLGGSRGVPWELLGAPRASYKGPQGSSGAPRGGLGHSSGRPRAI